MPAEVDEVLSFYDRGGEKITFDRFSHLKESGDPDYGPTFFEYTAVRRTQITDDIDVRTDWMGISLPPYLPPDLPPLIFETMVFAPSHHDLDLACERYMSEEQAIEGHDAIVAELAKQFPDAVPVQTYPPSQTPTEE